MKNNQKSKKEINIREPMMNMGKYIKKAFNIIRDKIDEEELIFYG